MSRTTAVAALLAALLAPLVGCGSGGRDDPILRLSATEALDQGRALLEAEKYREARKYLIHAFEVEPNSSSGREGLLLAADALYLQGGIDAYVEAETRYRDFLNRFPTSPRADYAQYRLAMSLAQRMEKPNRDQQTTRKALSELEALMRAYPTSEWIDDARLERERVNSNLAEHEFVVARFYLRYGNLGGAIERSKYVLDNYPEYPRPDEALSIICRGYSRAGQAENAAEWCGRLREEYPESEYLEEIEKVRQAKRRKGAPESKDETSEEKSSAEGESEPAEPPQG